MQRKTVVVIGNGMVGHRFCERLVEYDLDERYQVVTFCEEPRPAYDRVNLTKYFEHRDAGHLQLARQEWYAENGITFMSATGPRRSTASAGSSPRSEGGKSSTTPSCWRPARPRLFRSVPGVEKKGVFVYRTIEDLERILAYAGTATRAAVIGGGLLGLEAAKAVRDLDLETHVVEFAPRLMPRQVDDAGRGRSCDKIESLGVKVHLDKSTEEFLGNGKVEGLEFTDGGRARRRHGRHLGGDPPARRAGPRLRPGGRPARGCRRR